jgi:hypothetical protein
MKRSHKSTEGVMTEPSVEIDFGRDRSAGSARNSSKGALVAETFAVFHALGDGLDIAELRSAALETRLFRQAARETRRRIRDAIHWRYFAWNPPTWVIKDLCTSALTDSRDSRFLGLVYLHYARRDRITYDFVTHHLFQRWRDGHLLIRRDDVLDFISNNHAESRAWSDNTRKKLAGNVLSALRDFGLLTGVRRKVLHRPIIVPEVTLHLCRLLYSEGLRGRTLLESRDWRLFLWDVDDIAQALGRLAQQGQIRFERSGRTVVLDVPDPLGGA